MEGIALTDGSKIREWESPKSLEDFATEQADDGRGLRCPKCGCAHLPGSGFEVSRTIALGQKQSIRRRRVCRNASCNHEFTTMEVVVGMMRPAG